MVIGLVFPFIWNYATVRLKNKGHFSAMPLWPAYTAISIGFISCQSVIERHKKAHPCEWAQSFIT